VEHFGADEMRKFLLKTTKNKLICILYNKRNTCPIDVLIEGYSSLQAKGKSSSSSLLKPYTLH
jgi:hypothetical protein